MTRDPASAATDEPAAVQGSANANEAPPLGVDGLEPGKGPAVAVPPAPALPVSSDVPTDVADAGAPPPDGGVPEGDAGAGD